VARTGTALAAPPDAIGNSGLGVTTFFHRVVERRLLYRLSVFVDAFEPGGRWRGSLSVRR